MISAYQVAILFAGVFFLNGLITGVWKYSQIAASEEGFAHPYVDIAQRSSLLYSFAAMLIAMFVEISPLSNAVELVATLMLVVYFTLAIGSYMIQGFLRNTDNQLREMTATKRLFMWSLIIAEILGFIVLFYGALIGVGLIE